MDRTEVLKIAKRALSDQLKAGFITKKEYLKLLRKIR